MADRLQTRQAGADDRADPGPAGNQRLTASLGVVLLGLLAAEGATLLALRPLLGIHVFLGMMLVPPVALKIASTSYRMVRFYSGAAGYVSRGAPMVLSRLLGPVIVFLTAALIASGVGLLYVPPGPGILLTLHKASFVLWFGAMSLHVLLHVLDLPIAAAADWVPGKARIAGAISRRELVLATVVLGGVMGFIFLPLASPWQHWLASAST